MRATLAKVLLRGDVASVPADWERPSPPAGGYRRDVIGAVLWWLIGVLGWWLTEQFNDSTFRPAPWQALLGLGLIIAPLTIRRRWPLISLLLASAAFLGVGLWMPTFGNQLAYQAAYFAALYSAAAWAKDTRAFRVCAAVVLAVMFGWVILSLTLARSIEQYAASLPDQEGVLPPLLGFTLYTLAMNIGFFGGALFFGRRARAGAWQRELLESQAEQLRRQGNELARRAVVDERLRIARELHDVVAHHISAVGVQAAAARRVQGKAPETTARLLGQIEESSRQALAETRSLLGVLRTDTSVGSGHDERGERSPEPGLGELEGLAERSAATGVSVELTRVEDPAVPFSSVPSSLGLSLYRITQEALSNVRRHSTARSATVALRTGHDGVARGPMGEVPGAPGAGRAGEPVPSGPASDQPVRWAEVEIIDRGRPRPGTSGGGFGLRGIRERAALHRGEAEVGPRTTGGAGTGFRVRVRVPLDRPAADHSTADAPERDAALARPGHSTDSPLSSSTLAGPPSPSPVTAIEDPHA